MLKAGVSLTDISPKEGVRLAGYPHCPRPNKGVHDPLYAAALYLDNGKTKLAIVTLDILYIGKQTAKEIRAQFPFPILFTATHTHSGPRVYGVSDDGEVDAAYLAFFKEQLAAGIRAAMADTFDAEIGTEIGKCGAEQGVGGNRRVPNGLCDPTVNVLAVRDKAGKVRACLTNYALHPTYLHAENELVTADYPCYIRRFLHFARPEAVAMFAQGASGNQSSRYHRVEQSFEEAARVGATIGVEVNRCLDKINFSDDVTLASHSIEIDLPMKSYPPIAEAEEAVKAARAKFESLKGGDYIPMRNAELAMFGAENTLMYAKLTQGEFKSTELPMEIQFVTIGDTLIIAVQGEIFVEYGLQIRALPNAKKTFFFEVSNGALVGYVCTPEAIAEGGYETGTTMLAPEAGAVIVEKIREELKNVQL